MKITFFSNFLNHHQAPFCEEIIKIIGENNFRFVSTEAVPDIFFKNGYLDYNDIKYNIKSYESLSLYSMALKLSLDSDVVIIGSASEIFIKERIKKGLLTFRYSERWFKEAFFPKVFFSLVPYGLFKLHTLNRRKNVHMLCASSYLLNDCKLFFSYPNKMYKWGYFTKVQKLDIESVLLSRRDKVITIIWCARYIDWKHPELVVKMAKILKDKGYLFKLIMIGDGVLYEDIKQMIINFNLLDIVVQVRNIPNSEVINYMSNAHIFVFTSDRKEGWGAVLNEAMSCGCAVVSSNKIGSTNFLINDNQNGLIFKSNKVKDLVSHVEVLLKNQEFREDLSRKAYQTMSATWNPQIAALNFFELSSSLLKDKKCIIIDGPCSKA